jgi:hypothetical protein
MMDKSISIFASLEVRVNPYRSTCGRVPAAAREELLAEVSRFNVRSDPMVRQPESSWPRSLHANRIPQFGTKDRPHPAR